MTCKEAIQTLKREYLGDTETMELAKFMGVKALEKQIPEKPIRANRLIKKDGFLILNDDNEYWKCPICTKWDVPLLDKQEYCHCCGQALDWEGLE